MSGNWFGGDYIDPAHGCPNCSVPAARAIEYRRWYQAQRRSLASPFFGRRRLHAEYPRPRRGAAATRLHGCPRRYAAAVSYADHILGMALNALDGLGETASTITIFHADHGYQLGELNEWSKKTNTELSLRVPLIVRVPWKTEAVGRRCSAAVELVDIYRTLVSLAGLDVSAIEADVQGSSLAPLFDDPGDSAFRDRRAYAAAERRTCSLALALLGP